MQTFRFIAIEDRYLLAKAVPDEQVYRLFRKGEEHREIHPSIAHEILTGYLEIEEGRRLMLPRGVHDEETLVRIAAHYFDDANDFTGFAPGPSSYLSG